MRKISKVDLYAQIRRVHRQEGVSIRELSRRFSVHRRDVRAALDSPVPPDRLAQPPRPAPRLDPWKPITDQWLLDDFEAPRKQRHTGRRVWERLVAEHGADVGQSTVRAYVKTVKDSRVVSVATVTVPQRHEPGFEAEVDFGEIVIDLAGQRTKAAMFVMRLSASGKGFSKAYLNETQDALLDGHCDAFEFFGGVPIRVR